MTPLTCCTPLFQREELCPGSELLGGKKFAAPSWSRVMEQQGISDPLPKKRDPLPLQGISSCKGKNIFPLFASVLCVEVI